MVDVSQWNQAKDMLHNARQVLLLCHDRADADAINAVAAFGMWLSGLSVDFRFAYFSEWPEALFVLDDSFDLAAHLTVNPEECDVIVVLDTGARHLLGEVEPLLTMGLPIICIDHHKSNEMFGDINIVETGAAAACELLYDLFQDRISPNMAHSLLGGILGDTHNLSTSHVTPATLHKVAELMDLGADRVRIIEGMPLVRSVAAAKIWGELLETIQVAGAGGEIAYTIATRSMIAAAGLTYLKNISSFIGNIGGVEVAILFLVEAEQHIRVEFRSKPRVDVGKIAEALGGGGHRGASGCLFRDMPIEEAVRVTLDTVTRHMGN